MTLADFAKVLDVIARVATVTAKYVTELDKEIER